MTIDQHVTLAARLWIIYSALILIGSFTGTMFFLVLDRHDSAAGESRFLSLVSLPGIAGGIALFKRRSWARMLLLVLGFLRLVSFPPIGTALGVYHRATIQETENRRVSYQLDLYKVQEEFHGHRH